MLDVFNVHCTNLTITKVGKRQETIGRAGKTTNKGYNGHQSKGDDVACLASPTKGLGSTAIDAHQYRTRLKLKKIRRRLFIIV